MLVENHSSQVIPLGHGQKGAGPALPLSWEAPISVQNGGMLSWRFLGQAYSDSTGTEDLQ